MVRVRMSRRLRPGHANEARRGPAGRPRAGHAASRDAIGWRCAGIPAMAYLQLYPPAVGPRHRVGRRASPHGSGIAIYRGRGVPVVLVFVCVWRRPPCKRCAHRSSVGHRREGVREPRRSSRGRGNPAPLGCHDKQFQLPSSPSEGEPRHTEPPPLISTRARCDSNEHEARSLDHCRRHQCRRTARPHPSPPHSQHQRARTSARHALA